MQYVGWGAVLLVLFLWWQDSFDLRKRLEAAEQSLHSCNFDLGVATGDNHSCSTTIDRVLGDLQVCEAEAARIKNDGAQAVANARADARDAERTLRAFMDRYATRGHTCDAALKQLGVACSDFADY